MEAHEFNHSKIIMFENEDVLFEKSYLKVRSLEDRVYTIEEVKKLPLSSKRIDEWKMRAASAKHFLKYINQKEELKILDIGCGNGWFTNFISSAENLVEVIGIDINLFELKQANDAFSQNKKIKWIYGDLFNYKLDHFRFDIIVLNGCIQYFEDFEKLINRLLDLCNKEGEIHILDSPFCKNENDKKMSILRSNEYYKKLGCDDMLNKFTPHTVSQVKKYNFEILKKPTLTTKILTKISFQKIINNPFMWIKIIK